MFRLCLNVYMHFDRKDQLFIKLNQYPVGVWVLIPLKAIAFFQHSQNHDGIAKYLKN